jgi:hypothetical protein
MVTNESLREQYSKMLTEDLLEIAKDKVGYTELANTVALEELKRRKVASEEIAKYEPLARKINAPTRENCLVDLEFPKKLFYFYVLWFPKARHFYSPNFMQNGYILKSNQSNYYSVLGFISIIATFIIVGSLYYNSIVAFLAVWITLFFLSYLFDVYFNRQRQMRNIQKAVDSGEIPWGF